MSVAICLGQSPPLSKLLLTQRLRHAHLCPYSIQKMNLNSSSVILECTFLNSGEARYLSNAACQSC